MNDENNLTLWDLEVLTECLKFTLRFKNDNLCYTYKTRELLLQKIFNLLDSKIIKINDNKN